MPLIPAFARCLRCGLAAFAVSAAGIAVVFGAEIDTQREIFKSVYPSVERGRWDAVADLPGERRELLQRYVLWPDLRAAYLRATLTHADQAHADHDEIEAFLAEFGVLRPARELRYRYALALADDGRLRAYLEIYQQFYQGLEIARLDCLALQAELEAGRRQRVVNRAIELWMVDKSQVNECDPVFEYLAAKQLLGRAEYLRRFELAIDAREFSLARWLAKSIDATHVDIAGQWSQAHNNAENFIRRSKPYDSDETTLRQLVHAVERLTYRDPVIAQEVWADLIKGHAFSAEQEIRTARHIALWTARDRLPGAYSLLVNLPVAAQNDEVLRWRARTSLRHRNWTGLLDDIAQMSVDENASEKWRYWRGVALQRSHQVLAADQIFTTLAVERSYYGFLAADELGLAYALDDDAIMADEEIIAQLANRPELIRAHELLVVGLDGRGRSEWDAVVAHLTPEHKAQAAKLANRWGWHSRAISAAASVGHYDDLTLRYPLPYRDHFRAHAESAQIPSTWAYGVARSESLFMRDVRSSAGAIGLMQLMPATGRDVAKDLQLPYSGVQTLTDPQSNIRLGTTYLSQMAARYGGNRVLATAAYNAGPHRVDRWLPESGNVDARVWIENIPFNETRDYVRRVMAAQTIFHWRMTGKIRRLKDELSPVAPITAMQQLASTH